MRTAASAKYFSENNPALIHLYPRCVLWCVILYSYLNWADALQIHLYVWKTAITLSAPFTSGLLPLPNNMTSEMYTGVFFFFFFCFLFSLFSPQMSSPLFLCFSLSSSLCSFSSFSSSSSSLLLLKLDLYHINFSKSMYCSYRFIVLCVYDVRMLHTMFYKQQLVLKKIKHHVDSLQSG